MEIKILNNNKVHRSFSSGLWIRNGIMFPWPKRKYLQIGFYGFIVTISYGSYKVYSILLLFALFTSCSTINHLEDSSNVLWYKTKALKVIEKKGNKYLLQSFSNPRRTYVYKSSIQIPDTLVLTDSIRIHLTMKRMK